jgi:hypothetical protein
MTTELVIWSPACGQYLYCPPDEITWLGRWLLSAGEDRRVHRKTICAGVRYVAHQWELFNRDTGREVYLAQRDPATPPSAEIARATAKAMLPAATPRLEPYPVRLDQGEWLVGIGRWFVVLFVGVPLRDDDLPSRPGRHAHVVPPSGGEGEAEHSPPNEATLKTDGEPPTADAVSKVRAYFDKRGLVHMAIAYYYQDFILAKVAPQEVPMTDVAVAMNLTNHAAIADYKKELQRLIWDQSSHHQRALAEFLITSGLIDHVVLQRARQLAEANEKTGKASNARQRFGYKPRRPD